MASAFSKLCNELSARVTPALVARGFATADPPFNRHQLGYDFKREVEGGRQVISLLFDKYRRPLFSVQIYVEPECGLESLMASGGTLVLGALTAQPRSWPFALVPFRVVRPKWQRMLGMRDSTEVWAVTAFLNLLPEIEVWWPRKLPSKHIRTGVLRYPGRSGSRA